jgi:flagellar hook-associated protein 1 FlgK
MPTITSALFGAAGTLRAYEKLLAVAQNNVANATTPGYVRQRQALVAASFDPDRGLPGGVQAGGLLDGRLPVLEQGVWRQQGQLGGFLQQTEALGQLTGLFDLTGRSGVSAALSRFFGAFSELAVNPNNTVSRQGVLDQARAAADAFRVAATELGRVTALVTRQTTDAVRNVNGYLERVRDLNATRRTSGATANDPALDAAVYATLEELAAYAAVTAVRQPDGTFSLYLGGQTPLLIGTNLYRLEADVAAPETVIRDAQGAEGNGQLGPGRLRALVDLRNRTLPAFAADLDRLARTFADDVNGQLAAGLGRDGVPPAVPLFTYDDQIGAAFTLAVTALGPEQLAAAAADAPGGNGNAIALARLGESPRLDGFTYQQFFGNLGGRVGRELNAASGGADVQRKVLSQARTLRAEASGVSLDEEAAYVLQAQRSYQAAAKIVTVLNELTETILTLLR